MNLKESFRYQNFLESMMCSAGASLTDKEHSLIIKKKHLRKKANADTEDVVETVDAGEFFKNDDVMHFMSVLVGERDKLTNAIGKAKASIGFDLDAAIETNKFRQNLANCIKTMLRFKPSKKTERGTDYKFNVEGNQTQYYYDVEVEATEAYDRDKAKAMMRSMILDADKVSAEIDTAIINTPVEYEAPFNVNDSFEDVMADFISKA